MPFTPIHMGPGIFLKSLLQGSFSLMVFGWAQIIMDIQPLVVLITGEGHLHGFTHTYVGATLLAIFSALTGKYLSELGLRILRIDDHGKPISITWKITFISSFVGTYSHVILDSIMHRDVEPFYPFFSENELLGMITVAQLHKLCLYSGLVGAVLYFVVSYIIERKKI
ncbi:MAG: metal-dependent hydrolase [Gammaproteobacteria bacterium]|nr:metal-dependent hydrolase [Gammaproteobacteria bacterium]MDH5631015.1 metal-dependent hydrolase [Gammaproteobacteria bacterium]